MKYTISRSSHSHLAPTPDPDLRAEILSGKFPGVLKHVQAESAVPSPKPTIVLEGASVEPLSVENE